jgi:streptogramin lyase
MNGPSGLGVDSTGSVWVASYFSTATKFTPVGGLAFSNGVTGGGLNNSYGLAMDLKDNAWVPNEQPYSNATTTGSVSEFDTNGNSLAGTKGYTAGGLNYPISVAIDPDTTSWVVDYGNSHLTLLNSSGVPTTASGASGFTSANFSFPVAVVVDGNHMGWVANQSGTTVTKVSNDGKIFTNYDCCNGASGIAIDQGNNVWVANYYGSSVSLISNAGSVISNGTYTGAGGINHPQGIAVDGAGNVWVANYRAAYLSELTGSTSAAPGTSLTPATGYGTDAQLLEAYALAVDASGSVWVSNFGSNTVTKFLGLATPVKTPLSGVAQAP